MADSFELEIASPDRLLVRERAKRAQVPGRDGYMGILPDHAAMVSELGIGVLTYVTPEDHRYALAIKHGFIEVFENHVRVLSDEAEFGGEIDITQAERDLRHAQNEALNPNVNLDLAYALISWKHAQARIDAARKAAEKSE